MGFLSKLIGAEVAEPVKAIGGVLDELFTSDEERLTKQEALTKLALKPHLAQAAITQAEAQHRSPWVAGWRPGIGWVAGLSLFFFYVPQYVMASYVWVKTIAANEFTALPPYPVTADGLLELVLALIGLGTLRTIEKVQGRAK